MLREASLGIFFFSTPSAALAALAKASSDEENDTRDDWDDWDEVSMVEREAVDEKRLAHALQ